MGHRLWLWSHRYLASSATAGQVVDQGPEFKVCVPSQWTVAPHLYLPFIRK